MDFPSTSLRDYVSSGLREGFSLRCNPGYLVSAQKNNKSAYEHPDIVSTYLATRNYHAGQLLGLLLPLP